MKDLVKRLLHIEDTPERTAVAYSIGVFLGFSPFLGLHTLVGLAIAFLFGLRREAFPVDTHILRIGKRLGFIPEGMHAEKAHLWMIPLIPKKKSLSLHLNLIRFGRAVCKAKNPSCHICFISGECLCFDKNVPMLRMRRREVKR